MTYLPNFEHKILIEFSLKIQNGHFYQLVNDPFPPFPPWIQ